MRAAPCDHSTGEDDIRRHTQRLYQHITTAHAGTVRAVQQRQAAARQQQAQTQQKYGQPPAQPYGQQHQHQHQQQQRHAAGQPQTHAQARGAYPPSQPPWQ
jgi:hypothetical protein